MIGQKEEKKLRCEARFADQSAAPKTSKVTNCRSGNWPRFWGQIWCWKRVFSVCMCSFQWIRGVCICPASWPGVKNTIAELCAIFCKQSLLYVGSGDFSRLFCCMCLAVHNEGPQPRGQKCLFLRPQKQAPHRARLPELGLCSQDSIRWDWRPRVAGARTVLAEALL